MFKNIKEIVASCLIGVMAFSILPSPSVKAADGDIKINKQAQSTTGTEFVFNTGTVSNYKPLKFVSNLDKYPVFYLESKDIDGDVLFCNIIEGDATVNTQMINTLAKMSFALQGNVLPDLESTQLDEIYQALIWRELSGTSREDVFQEVTNNDVTKNNMSKLYDLARTNIENETELLKQLNLVVDQERATYDRKSSGYIYYGPVIVKCDNEINLNINYSKTGAVLTDRVGGEQLTRLKTGQNFYVRFDKDKSFTDFFITFTGNTRDLDVVFLSVNGSNKPNLIGVMPVERQMQAVLDFADINNRGTITVKKEPAVSGFEYTVYTKEGVKVLSQTTSANGIAIFNGLEMGSYLVRETKRPEFYTADENEYPVELIANGDNVTVNTSTVRQTAFLQVNVLDDLSPIRGCVFNIKSSDSGAVDRTIRIDGQETLELPLGSYTIMETESNSMYEICSDTYSVTLGSEGSTEEITIAKKRANSFVEVNLPNGVGEVKVDIQDERGTLITTLTLTGSSRIGIKPGSYRAVINSGESWVPDRSTIPFQVVADETIKIDFGLERAAGVVTINTKYDGSNLADVEVDIRDVDERTVSSVKTNTEGVASVKNLKPGTYMAVVAKAPTDRLYDRPSVPFIYEGIDLSVVITLQQGAQQITNTTRDDEDRTSSSDRNQTTSRPNQTIVDNQYPTLEPDDRVTINNQYPTLDPEDDGVQIDLAGSTPFNNNSSSGNGTGTNNYSGGRLPHTGIEDYFDYRILVSFFIALLAYILLCSFKRKQERI